jgi:hypothetical protein
MGEDAAGRIFSIKKEFCRFMEKMFGPVFGPYFLFAEGDAP